MTKNPAQPPRPTDRVETIRHGIISAIDGQACSAREISAIVGIPEKEVCGHLAHIQKTVGKKGGTVKVTAAECKKCGFVFKKRAKLKKPGRCPVCRGESIRAPFFEIR